MRAVTKALLAGVVAAGCAAGAAAHHSFPATYHTDRTETISGKVVAFVFRNPHSFLQVMAPDKQGKMQRWAIEWSAGATLAGQKVTPTTLRAGDVVTVTGNPSRSATEYRMRMNSIVRPKDGWKWAGTVE